MFCIHFCLWLFSLCLDSCLFCLVFDCWFLFAFGRWFIDLLIDGCLTFVRICFGVWFTGCLIWCLYFGCLIWWARFECICWWCVVRLVCLFGWWVCGWIIDLCCGWFVLVVIVYVVGDFMLLICLWFRLRLFCSIRGVRLLMAFVALVFVMFYALVV